MSEQKKITISPEVQLTEVGAQKGFLEQRVLLLSQMLHDLDAELTATKEKLSQSDLGRQNAERKIDELKDLLNAAELENDKLYRQINHPPDDLPKADPAAPTVIQVEPN